MNFHNEGIVMLDLIQKGMDEKSLETTIYNNNNCNRYIEYLIESQSELSGYYYFKEYDKGKLIGFSEWRVFKDSLFLNNIYLNPEYKGKGLGKRLFKNGIELCGKLKIRSIELDVFYENSHACDWYRRMGFQIESESFIHKVSKPETKNVNLNCTSIRNYSQTMRLLESFGFTTLCIDEFNVGVLNKSYFRINNIEILNNKLLMNTLNNFDECSREFLYIENKYISRDDIKLITKSIRMKLAL